MPDLDVAVKVIREYESNFLKIPNPDWNAYDFEKRIRERAAVDMLIEYLSENWFTDTPVELICDFIMEARYNISKYCGGGMANFFFIVKETAEEILYLFL